MWTPAGPPMGAKPSRNSEGQDFSAIIALQVRELMDAWDLESDLDLAYHLQLEEALAASLASQTPAFSKRDDIGKSGTLQSEEIAELDQVCQDWLQWQFEMRKTGGEYNCRLRDQSFAREIPNFPDDNWSEWGGSFRKPFGEGCSKGVEKQGVYRLYFKGLVSEEGVGNDRRVLAGIGIAICDPTDELIFELRQPLIGNGRSKIGSEVKALMEGLKEAKALGLNCLCFYCDYYPLFQFVTGKWPPKQRKIAVLLNQVALLQSRFHSCNPRLVARHDIKFAFKLAREAIVSQITQTEVPALEKKLNVTCVICFEDCDVIRMFAVDGCLHRFCFSCMKQHVEVKLLQGFVPKCPHDGCKFDLNVDSCAKFLTPKDIATMRQRIEEASIPVCEKVYCPYPRCSALMSKGEVLEYTKDVLGGANQSGIRKCKKCHGLFCINCKVPWHNHVSCNDYKRLNHLPSEDVKLKSLASENLWRQCVKCNHMIELAEGCFHMTCRCGYEFCYNCGAEWKNKTATCPCPLWDEDRIWFNDENRNFFDDNGDLDEEDEDMYDFDDDYYYI